MSSIAAAAHPYSALHMSDLWWQVYSALGWVTAAFTVVMAVLAIVRLRPARKRASDASE